MKKVENKIIRYSSNNECKNRFMISIESLQWKGKELKRPECVLATCADDLYVSDERGGVTHIKPDGSQQFFFGRLPQNRLLHPNGIALRRDGSILVAHLGDEEGGVYELFPDGTVKPFLLEVDGVELPPTNFVHQDRQGRIWVTVSTRRRPRTLSFRADVADGFIVLKDEKGSRIVADNLGFTNEAVISPDGRWLYVNETFARRLSRFCIAPDGSLGKRETVTQFGHGTFPDGLAFDVEGGLWITSIISNRVIRVDLDGSTNVVLEDADPARVAWCEEAYLRGELSRDHIDRCAGRFLKNISSLAFGGSDLRTVYLGCLKGDSIASFRSPISGFPPNHWTYPDHAPLRDK